jgi:hypothetical protein
MDRYQLIAPHHEHAWLHASPARLSCCPIADAGSDANQPGNAGEGRSMTDRTNLVVISSLSANTPVSATMQGLFIGDDGSPDVGLASRFAFLDQKQCKLYPQDTGNDQQAADNCALLNSAPAYFNGGLIKMRRSGSHYVASTRLHAPFLNFSGA